MLFVSFVTLFYFARFDESRLFIDENYREKWLNEQTNDSFLSIYLFVKQENLK